MSSITGAGLRRSALGGAVALVVIALAVGPALADTEAGHTGHVGAHALRDSIDTPGARCNYGPPPGTQVPYPLRSLRVKAPMIWARNVTAGFDQQMTGWRFIVERSTTFGGPWTLFYRSPIQKHKASDVNFAAFGALSASLSIPEEAASYRVLVKAFWYRNGLTEGTATHIVDFYRLVDPLDDHVFGPQGFCPDGRGN